ncbi:heavy metal translocating P-type ATPase [Phenylobacterium sp. 58.2.17]|uniref:heavy metal translocating P-type ATPase n=1 Tax=Phenylobacterium sp. 58.2.17 TaxID=2969306 RepID=UPI002263EC9D|nr:heavy metal translocating P-type ATPase [Phenylobacterium sp. 58.2.17]MCX7587262.1 heavy metal translocating P-type ATPase [Phenylobacterium sp. 58.2.17]
MNAPFNPAGVAVRQSFPIAGMTCASCVRRVELAIAKAPGVASASVNLATEAAEVTFDPSAKADAAGVIAAIKGAGYEVPVETSEVEIEGMTCASCVRRVELAIAAVPGVLKASVNLATERATIETLVGAAPRAAIDAAIRKAGYEPRRADVAVSAAGADSREEARDREMAHLKRDLTIAAALTLPIFVLEMGSHVFPPLHHWLAMTIGQQPLYLAFFVLATVVQFGPGLRFYRKGVPALLRLAPDMNSLVVLGATAAWAYSVVAVFAPGALPSGTANVYFEASAVIITLILLGRVLEAKAKGRTSEAIKRLMGLQAKSARVERDGEFVDVALEDVTAGDVIQVRPGDKVPVDGVVLSGSSFVDEAMISGEPIPVIKGEGAEVIGGTINKTGSFTYRATKVGADTLLAQIIRMVETAQGSKLPIQALVDKVTAWFVPAVMLAAALTFVVWLVFGPEPAVAFALVNAVAVLIIACPCAMGLATPTSIMVGTGRAAELGVLFRNGEALQSLKSTQVVALDKTGTLTAGKPVMTDLEVAEGFERDKVLSLVAAVEAQSEHPVADAIVTAAKAEGLTFGAVEAFEAIPGFGVNALVDGRRISVGADRHMAQLGIDVRAFADAAVRMGEMAKTPLYAAVDGRLAAIIAVSDPIKPTTQQAIRALHEMGLKVAMITGDNRRTAEAIAAQLGIDEVVAEVLPDGKVEAIKRLREGGRAVAFVGDGINDAPALAEADVGIAIGTGTDVAIESADVVLMSGDLLGVSNAIALSKATIANIRQNLFWAFAYNASLIPVAAGVLYPVSGTLLSPMLAAGAMALSSVFVLGNAMRLKRFKAPVREAAPASATGHWPRS